MAEVTAMRNNALPYPIYGVAWTIVFPLLDADGDLVTGATTPDSEVSKNGDTFADCTNEMTEIATGSGVYYLTLTASEMTADVVTVIAKSATSGMKTTVATLYPRKLVAFKASATSQAGAAGTITFDSGASAIDDYYNGMLIVATLDGAVEARICTDYVGSTKVASVTPNWNTTPDSDDTFIVYLVPETSFMQKADLSAIAAAAVSTSTAQLGVNVVNNAGSAITSASGIQEVKVASIANGAITAAAIATDAIDNDAIAANAVTEIQAGLSTLDAAGIRTAVGLASANLDTQLGAIDDYIDSEVAAIKAKTDLIPGTLDGYTLTEALVVILAALAGKASGLGTTTAVYRAADDSLDRITATVDADGNRSAVTLDVSSP